ncbi:MAG: hypothetical protein UHX00_09830 [Caryophanon sp.]|nr:hypothetical protein [Caryophanon sp.]
MKKVWLFSTVAIVMLSACNSTQDVTEDIVAPVEENETEVVVEPANDVQPEAGTVTESVPPSTETEQQPVVEETEIVKEEATSVHEADAETVEGTTTDDIEPSGEVTYTQNNETYSTPTNFTTSSEQPFGLEVMDGFTLVAEEPGKDQLLYTSNERVSMAIETFTFGEKTYDDVFAAAMDQASAMGDVTPIEELPMSDNISNIAAFEVNVNGEYVVVIALETPSILAQFTLMDTADRKFLNAMMQMAVTIQGQ